MNKAYLILKHFFPNLWYFFFNLKKVNYRKNKIQHKYSRHIVSFIFFLNVKTWRGDKLNVKECYKGSNILWNNAESIFWPFTFKMDNIHILFTSSILLYFENIKHLLNIVLTIKYVYFILKVKCHNKRWIQYLFVQFM